MLIKELLSLKEGMLDKIKHFGNIKIGKKDITTGAKFKVKKNNKEFILTVVKAGVPDGDLEYTIDDGNINYTSMHELLAILNYSESVDLIK